MASESSAANRQECCGGYPTLLVAQGWAGICDYCPHRPPGEEPCADNAATVVRCTFCKAEFDPSDPAGCEVAIMGNHGVPENFPRTPDHRIRSVVSFTLPSTGERWNWPMDRTSVDVFAEILDRAGIAWKVGHS